jgi:adenylate cyclase
MKRIFYVSQFSRSLSKRDMESIHQSALRHNSQNGITGILVCLGDTFFQVLEGKPKIVDALYNDRILPDKRHKNVLCLKAEGSVRKRMFPEWDMRIFNLNEEKEVLPMAFRQMLAALLESSQMIAQYTQPSIFKMLEQGINPTLVKPRRKRVTVLFSDIVGFSIFAEKLPPSDLIDLVNSHVEVCVNQVDIHGGEVNKLLGDGLLAYFEDRETDAAIDAARGILHNMKCSRSRASKSSPHRLLYGGVGLANGMVYEGNIGPALKKDFTILGNTVNLASRMESLTRVLNVRLTVGASVVKRCERAEQFESLGRHQLKGQSKSLEVFGLRSLAPLNIENLYSEIAGFFRKK